MAIELRGKIKDEYGNPLNNVTVEAYEEGIGTPAASTVTNSDGIWAVPNLDESKTWCIVASASGLQKRETYGGNKVQVAEITAKGVVRLVSGAALHLAANASPPADPPANYIALYAKSDGNLYVKNSSGVEATAGENWVVGVDSSTSPNGSQTVFSIGSGMASKKVKVYVNGIRRRQGAGKDFTHNPGDSTVTFLWAPVTGDLVTMDYVAQ